MLKKFTLQRIRQELVFPTKSLTRRILHFIHYIKNVFISKKNKRKIPYLIYDVRNNPITFDFVHIVFDAYLFFSKKGIGSFDLIIYEPLKYKYDMPLLKSYEKHVSRKEIKKRIKKIIIPIAKSFSCIKSVQIITSHKDIQDLNNDSKYFFPQFYDARYHVPMPHDYKRIYRNLLNIKDRELLPYIETKVSRRKMIKKVSDNNNIKKYVTLTLRDYGFNTNRNTTSKEIKIVSKYAKDNLLKLVIVPDNISNLKNYSIPKDVIIYSKARICLYERISLYFHSEVNFFVPSGPSDLSFFISSAKTIILKWGDPSSNDSSTIFYKKTYNIEYGQQPFEVLNGYLDWYSEDYLDPNYELQKKIKKFFN